MRGLRHCLFCIRGNARAFIRGISKVADSRAFLYALHQTNNDLAFRESCQQWLRPARNVGYLCMKIILAIAGIVLCLIGMSQGEAASIAETNRPKKGIAMLFSIIAFTLAFLSFGLSWYWALIIAIPCVLIIPLIISAVISGTHSQWAIDNMCHYASEGYSEAKLIGWVLIGLLSSVISVLL